VSQVSCPQCGANFPSTGDAYCPDCRQSLNDPPSTSAGNTVHQNSERPGSARSALGLLLFFGGLASVLVGLGALARREWPEAIYTGGAGVVMVCVGLIRIKRAGRVAQNPVSTIRPRYARRSAIVAGLVLGGALLVYAIQTWHRRPRVDDAEILGVAEPGDYRNQYLRIRIRYGTEWQDVSTEMRARVAQKSGLDAGRSHVLLAVARSRPAEQNEGASLIFMAELLPASGGIASGSDYLDQMLVGLQQRRDGPRGIKKETATRIGGFMYDRVSFTRTWGDAEVDMTYWARVTRGYAVVITGTYTTPEGFQSIETLLARVSDDADR